jgi:uncharacterized membrane protein YesL
MNMSNLLSKILALCQWLLDFAILNFLFVAGTLAGGVILGFFPAFCATIIVLRRLLIDEGKIAIVKPFIQAYKECFWQSLKIGYSGLFPVVIAFSNVVFWRQIEGVQRSNILMIAWLVVLVTVTLANLLITPIAVQEKLTLKEAARVFIFSLAQIHIYLILLAGLVVIYFGFLYITGAFILLGGSLTLAWITFSSYLLVKRIHKLQGGEGKV